MNKRTILALLALAGGIAVAGTVALAAGDAKKGREIYVKVGCWGCHGYNGQGGSTGPRIAPDPLPPEALASFIRNADKTQMPPYAEKNLSNQDVEHIHAWLASQPKAKDWKSIPLLQP